MFRVVDVFLGGAELADENGSIDFQTFRDADNAALKMREYNRTYRPTSDDFCICCGKKGAGCPCIKRMQKYGWPTNIAIVNGDGYVLRRYIHDEVFNITEKERLRAW